jgi:hypothetical protein
MNTKVSVVFSIIAITAAVLLFTTSPVIATHEAIAATAPIIVQVSKIYRSISEVASSYPRSHIVVLMNTHAHVRSEVESIALLLIANIFIEY